MKKAISFLLLLHACCFAVAQTCNQPGALLTARTAISGDAEYVVFTFVNPHKPKGELNLTKGPFTQTPLNNTIPVKGEKLYKISFGNSPVHCDTKLYLESGHKKIADVKRLQNAEGIISYVIGLEKDAVIAAHLVYNYHGFHIVKLKVQ